MLHAILLTNLIIQTHINHVVGAQFPFVIGLIEKK